MKKLIYETGRLSNEELELAKKHNLHVYQIRSSDVDNGFNVEKRVIVNHQADWITNFKVEFCENDDFINDDDFNDKYPNTEYVSLNEVIFSTQSIFVLKPKNLTEVK